MKTLLKTFNLNLAIRKAIVLILIVLFCSAMLYFNYVIL